MHVLLSGITLSITWPGTPAVMGVSINPGRTALHRIPQLKQAAQAQSKMEQQEKRNAEGKSRENKSL